MTLKQNILSVLLQSDRPVSGEELGKTLGVSRAAVCKAIKALREEGYEFSAVPNRGYTLRGGDVLSAERLKEGITQKAGPVEVIVLDEVDSTNNYLKARAAQGDKSLCAVVAKTQTAGRGRQGKSFFSHDKAGLYFSMLLPGKMIDPLFCTVSAAVAVCRTVEQVSDERPMIKWINDVFTRGKKICGILSEAVFDLEGGGVDCAVIGVGINLGTESFPPELKDIATGIVTAKSRNEIAAVLFNELLYCLTELNREQLIAQYRARLFMLGQPVSFMWEGAAVQGIARDINEHCNLIVECGDKTITLKAGEISVKVQAF